MSPLWRALRGLSPKLRLLRLLPHKAPPYLRGAQTFNVENNALFEDYDGLGGGRFCVSEQDINRLVAPSIPTRSASAGVEEYDIAAGDADDEQSDEEVEEAPIGPLPNDHPILLNLSKIPLYCSSCHQNVVLVRFNICPRCACTDSTLPMYCLLYSSDPVAAPLS